MKNINILISTLFFIFIIKFADSQSLFEKKNLHLSSMEGKSESVEIELNWLKNTVQIKLNPSEAICIDKVWSLADSIGVIHGKFISIVYNINAGTGIRTRKNILLCVSNGKILKALDILCMHSFKLTKTYNDALDSLSLYDEYSFYKLTIIDIFKSKQNNYQLVAAEYDTVKSKYDPSINQTTSDTIIFNFDDQHKVFFTDYMSLSGIFFINKSEEQQRTFIGNLYPYIKLKHSAYYYPLVIFKPEEYYYIDGVWYNKYDMFGPNRLIQVSQNCN